LEIDLAGAQRSERVAEVDFAKQQFAVRVPGAEQVEDRGELVGVGSEDAEGEGGGAAGGRGCGLDRCPELAVGDLGVGADLFAERRQANRAGWCGRTAARR
jgi:hypothetical protein